MPNILVAYRFVEAVRDAKELARLQELRSESAEIMAQGIQGTPGDNSHLLLPFDVSGSHIASITRGTAENPASGRGYEGLLCGGRDGETRKEDAVDDGFSAGSGVPQKASVCGSESRYVCMGFRVCGLTTDILQLNQQHCSAE